MYKTDVIKYTPKTENMVKRIEDKSNEMLKDGWELVTFSVTTTAGAILAFKK